MRRDNSQTIEKGKPRRSPSTRRGRIVATEPWDSGEFSREEEEKERQRGGEGRKEREGYIERHPGSTMRERNKK